jgi:hypothetical protein
MARLNATHLDLFFVPCLKEEGAPAERAGTPNSQYPGVYEALFKYYGKI